MSKPFPNTILMFAAATIATLLSGHPCSAQVVSDISAAGGPDTQRIVVIPRQGQKAMVLSLQGALNWSNSQSASPGLLKYRWGVMDQSGRFVASASEQPEIVKMKRTDSEETEQTVDRSILVSPGAGPDGDLLVAIRIEQCSLDPPDPRFPARCSFAGNVRAQQVP